MSASKWHGNSSLSPNVVNGWWSTIFKTCACPSHVHYLPTDWTTHTLLPPLLLYGAIFATSTFKVASFTSHTAPSLRLCDSSTRQLSVLKLSFSHGIHISTVHNSSLFRGITSLMAFMLAQCTKVLSSDSEVSPPSWHSC